MDKIFEVAASVSTPLALGGLVAAIFFFVLKQILAKNIFPRLSRDHGAAFLTLIVDRLFVLALVAMVLGFAGYVLSARETKVREQIDDTKAPPQGPKEPTKVVYKTCRDPSFGRASWQHSQIVDQSSGWRGGGGSQQNYCNELAASFIQANAIGSDREVKVLDSRESNKRDPVGHVEYNYSCQLEVSWGSVWNSKQDPICGTAP